MIKRNLKVFQGTRSDDKRLCDTCRSGVIMKGPAESEELIYCSRIDKRVPFRVVECGDYNDKTLTSLSAMQATAWLLRTDKSGQKIGFVAPKRGTDSYYWDIDDDD